MIATGTICLALFTLGAVIVAVSTLAWFEPGLVYGGVLAWHGLFGMIVLWSDRV